MLGDDLLVAPVVVEAATSRAVYFPAGCWQDPDGTPRVPGPTTVTVDAPLGVLPYFVRCGTEPVVPAPPTPTTAAVAPATPVPAQPSFAG